jgi:hypothetical protein
MFLRPIAGILGARVRLVGWKQGTETENAWNGMKQSIWLCTPRLIDRKKQANGDLGSHKDIYGGQAGERLYCGNG